MAPVSEIEEIETPLATSRSVRFEFMRAPHESLPMDEPRVGRYLHSGQRQARSSVALGTHVANPWIAAESVLLRLRAIAEMGIGAETVWLTMRPLIEGNAVIWRGPVEVLSGFSGVLNEVMVAVRRGLLRVVNTWGSEVLISHTNVNVDVEDQPESSATIAREVREASGLSTDALGALFPVVRESYQRWTSGTTTPSEADLKRLLALRHLFRDLSHRVLKVREWLLTPIPDQPPDLTPYELLRRGRLADVWDLVIGLPSRARAELYKKPQGEPVLLLKGSSRPRSTKARQSEEDLDDLTDWQDP